MIPVKTAVTDKAEMKYISFGEGEKNLIILPGLSFKPVTDSGEAVADAYACFGRKYTLWLFDRRRNAPLGYSIREMAADTAAVMQSLGIKKANLFGVSQGGMIAQYMAIDHPDAVNRMILGSTICRHSRSSEKLFCHWNALAARGETDALVSQSIDAMYSRATLEKYRDVLIRANEGISPEDLEQYRKNTDAILAFDSSSELWKITCPTLVIGSRGDRVFSPAASDELAERTKADQYIYGENYGHCVYDEAPDYKKRMMEFLER